MSSNGVVSLKNITYYAETGDPSLLPAGLSFGETTEFNVVLGDEFTAPGLLNPNNLPVTYLGNRLVCLDYGEIIAYGLGIISIITCESGRNGGGTFTAANVESVNTSMLNAIVVLKNVTFAALASIR